MLSSDGRSEVTYRFSLGGVVPSPCGSAQPRNHKARQAGAQALCRAPMVVCVKYFLALTAFAIRPHK